MPRVYRGEAGRVNLVAPGRACALDADLRDTVIWRDLNEQAASDRKTAWAGA